MIRRLTILLLIVGCVYGNVDRTKTQENNYKYILETGGKTAFYIIDYKIINDDINITKDGENWEIHPLAQIKQITDLNGIIAWEIKEDKFYIPIDKIDTNIMSHSEKLIFNIKYIAPKDNATINRPKWLDVEGIINVLHTQQ